MEQFIVVVPSVARAFGLFDDSEQATRFLASYAAANGNTQADVLPFVDSRKAERPPKSIITACEHLVDLAEREGWEDYVAEGRAAINAARKAPGRIVGALRRLSDIARVISTRQHAHVKSSKDDWSELYLATNEADSALAHAMETTAVVSFEVWNEEKSEYEPDDGAALVAMDKGQKFIFDLAIGQGPNITIRLRPQPKLRVADQAR